nr:hypothetical protein CFP56_53266 [Quercus suber]
MAGAPRKKALAPNPAAVVSTQRGRIDELRNGGLTEGVVGGEGGIRRRVCERLNESRVGEGERIGRAK